MKSGKGGEDRLRLRLRGIEELSMKKGGGRG